VIRDLNPADGPAGKLSTALAAAANLLSTQPALAAQRVAEILKDCPHHPPAILLLGAARHRAGDAASAVELLEPLAAAHPGSPFVFYELGLARGALRHGDAAVAVLRRAVELKPDFGDAWRALADHLGALGNTEEADIAHARHLRYATQDPQLLEAGAAMVENRAAQAETILRTRLRQQPADVAAIRLLAEVAAQLGRHGDSAALLAQCLELEPGLTAARCRYAAVLNRLGRGAEALAEVEKTIAQEPANPGHRNLKAAILGRIGDYAQAIKVYEGLLAEYPLQPNAWMSLGHALRSAGRRDDAIRAYRRSAELRPEFGEAWWSLANLKTFEFAPADLTTMQAQLARPDLGPGDRYHFHFALGTAFEARSDWGSAFSHYESGNRLRRSLVAFGPEHFASQLLPYKRLFSQAFFAARADFGAGAADPIFIVGMPRAGSTLVEQILSSHSAIEGTMELPNVIGMARALSERANQPRSAYPEVLATLDASEFRALGERYLEQTRIQRKTTAPFFIDKMPNNFAHIGLIHLMLPNAKIIDARRHPVACCFSAFKQHFPRGQHFTNDLAGLGRYYRDYVRLLAHFDAVLPGRIHRVIYERMIDDTEVEIRRLLHYCGLPFEPGCLRFHENTRAVRTASSEQVRRPIYREAVDYWRHFEPWLGPLKEALGPVLSAYPAVPEFD
jgi:predicted Zn-dependent protease